MSVTCSQLTEKRRSDCGWPMESIYIRVTVQSLFSPVYSQTRKGYKTMSKQLGVPVTTASHIIQTLASTGLEPTVNGAVSGHTIHCSLKTRDTDSTAERQSETKMHIGNPQRLWETGLWT